MHKVSTIIKEANTEAFMQEACRSPFGPKFDKITAARAAKMEVWGSSFNDDGEDFCEFRLFNEKGTQIATKRVTGF